MRAINIYALTRVTDSERIARMERQMSGRGRFLKVKEWETGSLLAFCENLKKISPQFCGMHFFYSFTLPKLGKEFDLLRVSDDCVVNIELKSGPVSDEAIKKQLLQNRYYLAMLGLPMHLFTYCSHNGRVVRLSHAGRLVEASFEKIAEVLFSQKNDYDGEIEDLFKENQYLISPLTDPGRFLRREYFLTSQQWDIRRRILHTIRDYKNDEGKRPPVQGVTGLPGTGKTILLYDLAMELSKGAPVCLFRFGRRITEVEQLNERLKRVDFYHCGRDAVGGDGGVGGLYAEFEKMPDDERRYSAILVDEGHRIDGESLEKILELSALWRAPVIISYDSEAPIALPEQKKQSANMVEAIAGFVGYRLTNRIRLNDELSAFIYCLMRVKGRGYRTSYPHVDLVFATDPAEANLFAEIYGKAGYVYIRDRLVDDRQGDGIEKQMSVASDGEVDATENLVDGEACDSKVTAPDGESTFDMESYNSAEELIGEKETMVETVDIASATSREFDKVFMLLDETFYYDNDGYLRSVTSGDGRVRHLYHGLNRARKEVALIVVGNLAVFDRLLGILQKKG